MANETGLLKINAALETAIMTSKGYYRQRSYARNQNTGRENEDGPDCLNPAHAMPVLPSLKESSTGMHRPRDG